MLIQQSVRTCRRIKPLENNRACPISYAIGLNDYFKMEDATKDDVFAVEFLLMTKVNGVERGDISVTINRHAAMKIAGEGSHQLLITVDHNYFASDPSFFPDIITPVIFFEPSGLSFEGDAHIELRCLTYLSSHDIKGSLDELSAKISLISTADGFLHADTSSDIFTYPPLDTEQWYLLTDNMVELYESKADDNTTVCSKTVVYSRISHFSGK